MNWPTAAALCALFLYLSVLAYFDSGCDCESCECGEAPAPEDLEATNAEIRYRLGFTGGAE